MAISTYKGLGPLLARQRAAMLAGNLAGGKQLAELVRAAAPENDGDLKDTVRTDDRKTGPTSCSVAVAAGGGKAFYGVMVHEGTGAHEIRPQDDGALSVGGATVESASHPGATANKFLETAAIGYRIDYIARLAAAQRAAF